MAPSASLPPSAPQKDIESTSASPILYEIKSLHGKGLGLFATQSIKPGTLIISETPIITTDVITSTDPAITEADLQRALNNLSNEDKKRVLALYNAFPHMEGTTAPYPLEDENDSDTSNDENHSPAESTTPANSNEKGDISWPLTGIVRTNTYPLGVDADVGGLFPEIARINHSCHPNCVQYWNPILERLMIHAIRDIEAGEEITTSYLPGSLPAKQRKRTLRAYFQFICTCELCSLPKDELQKSDKLLIEAGDLDKKIGDPRLVYEDPDEVFRSARRLFAIFNETKIQDGRLSRLYYDCFQTCNMHSDIARARCFTKYYLDRKKVAEGLDSLNVLEMKKFVKKPEEHESFGSTNKWKTKGSDVPKGLNSKAFARWLWRENA